MFVLNQAPSTTQIWSATTRDLTGGKNIFNATGIAHTSIAAGVTVTFVPASGNALVCTFTADNNLVIMYLTDGSLAYVLDQSMVSVGIGGVVSTATCWAAFVNTDGANAHNYMATYITISAAA